MRKFKVLYSVIVPGKVSKLISEIIDADTVRYNHQSYQFEFVNGTEANQFVVALIPTHNVLSVVKEG